MATTVKYAIDLRARNVEFKLPDYLEQRFIEFVREHGVDDGYEMFLDEISDINEDLLIEQALDVWPDRLDIDDMDIDTDIDFKTLFADAPPPQVDGQIALVDA